MTYFEINGGKPLKGEITVNGAKNAALKFMAAALLMDGPVTLSNVPSIEDVKRMAEIIRDLGVSVTDNGPHQYTIDAKKIMTTRLNSILAPKVRVSTLIVGALLIREGEAILPYPGGCAIGRRPIDFFIRGYKAFGATVEEGDDEFIFKANSLHPARIVFPFVSHTATEAMMMIASRIPGETVLVNCAMEPEVVALADFLNSCGAKIKGAGTPTISIQGVDKLSAGNAEIMPDRIEAGSFLAMAAATHGDVVVRGANPAHLEIPLYILNEIGVPVEIEEDGSMHVRPAKELRSVSLTTHVYPGFPTDLQSPFTVLLTQAQGMAIVHETIFEGRLFYIDKLSRMGANIVLADPHRAIVQGPTTLRATRLVSPDIRAGLAMVIAALVADGKSRIDNIYQIDRGYEDIAKRLAFLGADIQRKED